MKVGKTNLDIGTKIWIHGLKGEDKFLNDMTGTLTHPFPCFPIGDVGVYLDNKARMQMGICNLLIGEFGIF